jgi:hypothetical protein
MDMNELVKEAMFQALGAETREKLIKEALTALVTPKRNSYSSDLRSPLQEAFEEQVRQSAHAHVKEFMTGASLEAVQIRAQINDLVTKGWQRAMANSDHLVDKIADAIAVAFTSPQ